MYEIASSSAFVTQSSKSDGVGTTTYQHDALNRLTQFVPPSPRKQLDYNCDYR